MSEIDFKKNKERTRQLLNQKKLEIERQNRFEKIMMIVIVIFLLIIFAIYNYKITDNAIKECVARGNGENYCREVTKWIFI